MDVTAPVRLLESTDEDRSTAPVDGVRVAVQLRNTELWHKFIVPDDYSVHQPNGVTGLNVDRGDRIYFRVGSVDNGSYDSVYWDPVITYRGQPLDELDANKKQNYRFAASEDYLLSSNQFVAPPINPTLSSYPIISNVSYFLLVINVKVI